MSSYDIHPYSGLPSNSSVRPPEDANNMATPGIKLSELEEFISCPLCQGYLIDATTVNECLHTFCKSCIVKHIKNDHNNCPKCSTVIHERRPLDYIMHDRNKQDIVYKLVPQLYISELNKRITARETQGIDTITLQVLEKHFLYVVLVHRRKSSTINSPNLQIKSPNLPPPQPIYLNCPQTVKIYHLRKLLVIKHQLLATDKVTLLHKGDIVSDDDQVSNLAQSLTFCLQYEISRVSCSTVKREHDEQAYCSTSSSAKRKKEKHQD